MKVVEIFESIDGEGSRAGLPVTFIRLFGCNLRCSYCDSLYALEGKNYTEMAIEDIMHKVRQLDHKAITLTGGEPLIHKDVKLLIKELTGAGFRVNIETNGAVDITDYVRKRNIMVTLDYKCPSSKMEDKMILDNLNLVSIKDVVKFVVGSKEDLQKAKKIIWDYDLQGKTNVFISPVFGEIEPKEIVEFILKEHLDNVKVQLQLHKFIWDPNMKGV